AVPQPAAPAAPVTAPAAPAPAPVAASTGTVATGAVAGNGVPLGDTAAVRDYIHTTAASVLGLPTSGLQAAKPLKRQGLDSLMAAELRNRINNDLGMLLPIAKMLGGQSINDLADDVVTEAGANGGGR
ncbi:MAG: acyl carrier protein, partial [Actinocatenispora sp.]